MRQELMAFLEWVARSGGEARLVVDDQAGNVHDLTRDEAGVLVDAYIARRARASIAEYLGHQALPEQTNAKGFSVTINGVTLCTEQPLTSDERSAIGAYFRLMRAQGKSPLGGS